MNEVSSKSSLRRAADVILFLITWFAVIAQFVLMMQERKASVIETIIRFFSFFTILTNTLVAIYCTTQLFQRPEFFRRLFAKTGALTALTVYIFVVGFVYQLILRSIWNPEGLQKLVDELLHSIIPLAVLCYWFIWENAKHLRWSKVPYWLLYPLIYMIYVMIRGSFSDFYPYPFLNVSLIGWRQTTLNILTLVFLFTFFSYLFAFVAKKKS